MNYRAGIFKLNSEINTQVINSRVVYTKIQDGIKRIGSLNILTDEEVGIFPGNNN